MVVATRLAEDDLTGTESLVHGLGLAELWVVSAGQDGRLKVWDDRGELY